MLQLTLCHSGGEIVASSQAEQPYLALKKYLYQLGDFIELHVDVVPGFYVLQLDEALPESLIYLTEETYRYEVILEEELRHAYSPKLFSGERHYLTARRASVEEIRRKKNLALNPHDQKSVTNAFPHAFANVETRNDSTFFARNAIDGMVANTNHGSYPFQSWGINQQQDAEITVDFGREVLVEEIVLVLRGDYPHDSYWTQVTVEFSDSTVRVIYPTNVIERQRFLIEPKKTRWIKLKNLVKNVDESPFPALTELEVYGIENDNDK
ncbi:hypothetical protein IGI37_001341 [Enterococcus sp. AZ194]|uniref:discoidin domain-containing protein n=1 Tax=Enterococcus sp. AZ194 TaxID=2774629 RepID=UPI003F28D810